MTETTNSSATSTQEQDSGRSTSSSVNVKVIIGAVIGAVFGLFALIGLAWMWWLRRRSAPLFDYGWAKAAPTPFRVELSFTPCRIPMAFAEKQQNRQGEQTTSLPCDSTPLSSEEHSDTVGDAAMQDPSTANTGVGRHPQDQIRSLRSEIDNLRRIMLDAQVESIPEPRASALDAPPEYTC